MPTLAKYYPSPIVLPGLAGLLGLTGLAGGLYTLSSPLTVIKGFGLTPPASAKSSAFQTSLIRVYGVRTIGSGLSILGLTLAWALEKHAADRDVIKSCLGVVLTTASVVAFGDAWLVGNYVKSGEVDEEAREEGKNILWGHVGAGVVVALVGGSLLLA